MPIRINLKELFASDAQEMFIDKTNFNFNKLLELGIGDPGVQGLTGLTGSAGPSGNQGGEGQRGNKWFVGSGDPTSQVFTDLIENDFYLDTVNSSIWQYQGSPASWIEIADLSEIVTNIITNEGAPFVRGFGEASPLDDRYILFTKRGNDLLDIGLDVNLGNDSNNDILLLNNWNERVTDVTNFPINTNSEFNAIQQISVDQSTSSIGRYHLELSSLYIDPANPGDILLSTLTHNLKVRYSKDTSGSSGYPISNNIINTANFSMSIPATGLPTDIVEQGIFEFVVPKYNADLSPLQNDIFIKLGTTEALSETSSLDIASDGLEIHSGDMNSTISIGLIKGLEDFNSILTLNPNLYGNFGLIDTSSTLNGLMIKGDTYHTGGSLTHVQTSSEFEANAISSIIGADLDSQGKQGIFSDGKYLFAVSPGISPYSAVGSQSIYNEGALLAWDISNPDNPRQILDLSEDSFIVPPGGPSGITFDNNGNPSDEGPFSGYETLYPSSGVFLKTFLGGIRDVSFAGKYGCFVRYEPTQPAAPNAPDSFVIFELDSTKSELKIVSWLGSSKTFSNFMTGSNLQGSSSIPEMHSLRRVKISGNYAYCMSSVIDESVDPPPATTSHFMAVDITDATRPWISTGNISDMPDHINLDFDIQDNVAYILSKKRVGPDAYGLHVTKKQLFPQSYLSTTLTGSESIIEGFNPPYTEIPIAASIKAIGDLLYIVSNGFLYIYSTSDNSVTEPIVRLSDTQSSEINLKFRDIEISGNYAYIYAETQAGDSKIITFDITDPTNPIEILPTATTWDSAGDTLPSKMTLVGNRIFTICGGNGAGRTAVNSIKVPGIESSVGRIGSLQSDHIKVSNDISIGQTLQVGRSATIGSGGLWVDNGSGIHSDGMIVATVKQPHYTDDAVAGAVLGHVGFHAIASGIHYNENGSLHVFPIVPSLITIEDVGDAVHPTYWIVGQSISIENIESLGNVTGLRVDFANITTTTSAYGIFISGEDNNYFSSNVDSEGGFRVIDDGNNSNLGLSKGIGFYGIGTNNPDTQPEDPNTRDGQWHIEYLGTNGLNSPDNGLNFWKPFNSTNWGNYKLFLSDNGNISMGFDPLPDHNYGGVGNALMGKAYTYNLPAAGGATVKLAVDGAIGCTYVVTTSDSRLKDNIIDIIDPLERILKTRPVFYSWKDQDAKIPHGGFLAQDLEEIIPEAIRINKSDGFEGGKYSLHYDTILAVSVGAIKELHQIIETKEEKIKDLETRLAAIEEKIGL